MLRFIGAVVVVCIAGVFLVGFVPAFNRSFEASYRASSDASADKPALAEGSSARPVARIAALGETVHVGYWSYRIMSAHTQPMLLTGYQTVERAEGEFLVLELIVRNDDRTASILPPVKLVDELGREFSESSHSEMVPGAFDTLKELNPGMESRGYLIFDVGPGHSYRALLSGGFQSGSKALAAIYAPQAAASPAGSTPAASVPIHRIIHGIRYRQVRGMWIRMDMPNLCGSDKPVLGFPGVCKPDE